MGSNTVRPSIVSSHPNANVILWMPEMGAAWTPIPNTREALAQAIREGAMFVTYFAYSEEPVYSSDERLDPINRSPVRYGDLHFDLDDGEDPENALADLRVLVGRLLNKGVPERALRAYYSGKKGFHLSIAAWVFGPEAENGDRFLHRVYKKAAYSLASDLRTMDWRIFNGGLGRQFRLPNVLRSNGGLGRHKIPITLSEIDETLGLSIAEFESLAASPRRV